MGVWDVTRRLDQAVLPYLARVLAWCLRGTVRRRVLVGAASFASVGLLLASVWAAHEPLPRDDSGGVVRVGMAQGQSVGAYAEEAGEELEDLADRAGETYALVSFEAYLAPDRFSRVLSEISAFRGYARAVIPGADTDVVEITLDPRSPDPSAGMQRVADAKDEQARRYRGDASKLSGASAAERERRDSYLGNAEAAATEAAAYRERCSCLYAAVVRGGLRELARLADAPGVRAVDPAPEVTDLDRAVFLPPLPEGPDTSRPSSSPAPSKSPSESPSPSPSESETPSPSDSPPASPSPSDGGSGDSSPPPTADNQSSTKDDTANRGTTG